MNPRRDSWRPTPQAILERDEEEIAAEAAGEREAARVRVAAKRGLRMALRDHSPRARPSALAG